ncbi:hypothetical protein KFK09_019983 [Dendrobium nobile]|uniref:non-specific serine/threonine protein kinase n=1 Tax=Dendrobium nobile TaxID=94219 RepID=A0A8T3ATQ7_DENNO|nr:hypothetical protein KFK09_019983 [Dendrobium nobile]
MQDFANPHEDGHRRRRDVDRDRRCEALQVAQVEASINRIDVSFAHFNRSLERVSTSVSKLSSAICSHALSTDFALARFPPLPHGSSLPHPPHSPSPDTSARHHSPKSSPIGPAQTELPPLLPLHSYNPKPTPAPVRNAPLLPLPSPHSSRDPMVRPTPEATEKPMYKICGEKNHVSPNPSPLYFSPSSKSSERHRSRYSRCINITSVDGSSKIDWDCSDVCTDNDELNNHLRSSCNLEKSVAVAHECKVYKNVEEEDNRVPSTELRSAEDWPRIKKEFQILNHFVYHGTAIVKGRISSESRFLELKEKLVTSDYEDYAPDAIIEVFITGVQVLDVKSTNKANPTSFSQVARHNVADDFVQLGVDDFLVEIDLVLQDNMNIAVKRLKDGLPYCVALGIARALSYPHESCNSKIIYRDIKSANVFLDENFEAVVGDFGLAKLMDMKKTSLTTQICGTQRLKAPDYIATGKASEKTDVFGYDIMLLELVTGQRALCFEGRDDLLLLDHIRTLSFAISDGSHPGNEEREYALKVMHAGQQISAEIILMSFFLRNMFEYYQGGVEMIKRDLLTEPLKPYLERALTLSPCYYGGVNGGEVTAIRVMVGRQRRKLFDPGGLIINFTSTSLSTTSLDGVELF